MLLHNSLDLIENTPLVELRNISPRSGTIFAKAEFIQPGGSVKDRAALHIIKDAYAAGELGKHQPVVEMTSGNLGAGLAIVCNIHGNPFTAVMSAGNSPARARMLESLGAKVILVPQIDGCPGQVTGRDIEAATASAVAIARDLDGFYVDQFNNPSSIAAHYKGTGPEIWQDLAGSLDAFVAAVGSGGTFVGSSQYLKERDADIHCVAVEPEGCQILAGLPVTAHKHIMQGIGYGVQLPHWRPELVNEYLAVSNDEAEYYRKALAHKEGLYVGYSAAANVCASVKLIESGKPGKGAVVATILCDTGLKY